MRTILICLLLLLSGCEADHAYRVKILRVDPQHGTRAIVTSQYSDGSIRRDSVHHSATITAGNQTICIGDYVSRRKPYGEVK